jgi:hypothetical protein
VRLAIASLGKRNRFEDKYLEQESSPGYCTVPRPYLLPKSQPRIDFSAFIQFTPIRSSIAQEFALILNRDRGNDNAHFSTSKPIIFTAFVNEI